MSKHIPATPLPWKTSGTGYLCGGGARQHVIIDAEVLPADLTYINHAANAYPKLVEALRDYAKIINGMHTGTLPPCFKPSLETVNSVNYLLHELGEIK